MLFKVGKRLANPQIVRYMTTTEVSTALRPFYFSVHPDLFGQYPSQRTTNENSLKHLSSFIECLQKNKPIQPLNLKFFVKDKDSGEGSFKQITIKLFEKDLRKTVVNILKSLELSTEYVDGLPTPKPSEDSFLNKQKHYNIDLTTLRQLDPLYNMMMMKREMKEEEDESTLKNWLNYNYKSALEKLEMQKPVREDIKRLKKELSEKWGLKDVCWDCGWNEQHFKGCLQSMRFLAEHYPEPMHSLKDRVLVFAPFTGISLDGHIMLNSGEVRHNWLELIKNVNKHDEILLRIPVFEKCVSQVLRNIKIRRRKFMPKILAGEYEQNLKRITTAVNDYLTKNKFPKSWPASLEKYEIVVETESGPLMISPTGQIIVPASCPGVLLVNFITKNLVKAAEKMEKYKTDKHVERSLQKQCISELNLSALSKDDSISPDIMIECCQRLLKHKNDLGYMLKDLHLNVTTYYSVLSHGVVCIPWNWEI